MTKAIAAGEFIESAEYSGNMYGTRSERFNARIQCVQNVVDIVYRIAGNFGEILIWRIQ